MKLFLIEIIISVKVQKFVQKIILSYILGEC